MAEHYIHNRHSNTSNTSDVPELASIVVKDGVVQIGDGSTTLSSLPKVGDIKRYDLAVTDFTSVFLNITPDPAAGYLYVPHAVQLVQVGGDTAWDDLTNNHKLLPLGWDIDGTYNSFQTFNLTDATDATFVPALGENAVKLTAKAVELADETVTTYVGRPIVLATGGYGTPATTTKTSGGSGYVANEVITMASGATVTVLTVASGVVATYSVTGTGIALGADTQASTTGIGVGFTMTVDTVTRFENGTGTLKVSVWASLETI